MQPRSHTGVLGTLHNGPDLAGARKIQDGASQQSMAPQRGGPAVERERRTRNRVQGISLDSGPEPR